MTQTIGEKLVTTCANIIPVTLNEEAADEMPYAIYGLRLAELRTKGGGTVALKGTMEISVFAAERSTVKTKADAMVAAIEQGMQTQQYRTRLENSYSSCVNGVWYQYMEYSVAEYAVATTTTPTAASTGTENT